MSHIRICRVLNSPYNEAPLSPWAMCKGIIIGPLIRKVAVRFFKFLKSLVKTFIYSCAPIICVIAPACIRDSLRSPAHLWRSLSQFRQFRFLTTLSSLVRFVNWDVSLLMAPEIITGECKNRERASRCNQCVTVTFWIGLHWIFKHDSLSLFVWIFVGEDYPPVLCLFRL